MFKNTFFEMFGLFFNFLGIFEIILQAGGVLGKRIFKKFEHPICLRGLGDKGYPTFYPHSTVKPLKRFISEMTFCELSY